jgi:hypothetical protein
VTASSIEPTPAKRAILQVLWGPLAYRKAVIEPGHTLTVGRADPAELVIAHDEALSEKHFELAWDGRECRLRDLKSAEGTRVGGVRIEETQVANGGWVRAGATDFAVYIEGTTPPRDAGSGRTPSASVMRALEVLRGQTVPLYAVLDPAKDDRILEVLRESVEEYRSLYTGPQGEALADVAPHLVSLPRGSRLLEDLVHEGWGKGWGVYVACPLPFVELRRHFRKFLLVEIEEDERYYFRFYDPSVLRAFLPSCIVEQKKDFFGKIHHFVLEDETGEAITIAGDHRRAA